MKTIEDRENYQILIPSLIHIALITNQLEANRTSLKEDDMLKHAVCPCKNAPLHLNLQFGNSKNSTAKKL